MKILHTADWHIGKKLHKQDLSKDFDLFIDWLCKTIEQEKIQVIIISGDIFDLANPSSEARQQYYRSLMRLCRLGCKLVLTGGNHDSPAMLNAPVEVLRELDIHVIGGLPKNLEALLIPIKNEQQAIECVVAAVPYLRESDLRQASDGQSYEDRLEQVQAGITQVFRDITERCKTDYPGIPVLAMGHLFATGVATSESEREIQIGNQAAFNALQFGDYFSYIALGHIHKPQKVNALVPTFYSGSPIPLSFSERNGEKRVLLLDTVEGWTPKSVPIPHFRRLLKVSGTLNELSEKLQNLGRGHQLDSLIEVELREKEYDADTMLRFDDLVSNFDQNGFEIVKHRAKFQNQVQGATEVYAADRSLENLKPREVFQGLLGTQAYDAKLSDEILSAFDELLEEIYSGENS